MYEEEQPVEVGDETPDLISQAHTKGWNAEILDFGKAEQEGVEYFNLGVVRRPDGLWLLVRRSEAVQGMPYGMNKIWSCKLGPDRKPMGGPFLKFPDSKNSEQFEDPRAVFWGGLTWVGTVNFEWFASMSWTGAHQCIGTFKDESPDGTISEASWTPVARRDPIVGNNLGQAGHTGGKHEKNWTYFFHDDKLHLLYSSDPWRVVEFGKAWDEQTVHIADGVKWKYGMVRGGTPPVLVGDRYYTFFHSSLPWRGRYRRYYMGAIAFEARPPFNPVIWTQEPLLIGSQNDPWQQRKPLVVFPCGAVHENDKWFVTYGINDLKSGWVEIPHDHLLQLLNPIPIAPGAALLSSPTAKPEYEPIPFVEENGGDVQCTAQSTDGATYQSHAPNAETVTLQGDAAQTSEPSAAAQTPLEKARAVLAEKRRLGTLVSKPQLKRRRRRKKALKSKQ